MRGGTSKAVFLKEADLPAADDECQKVVRIGHPAGVIETLTYVFVPDQSGTVA
jgi:2-methylaconitate cis-trans-isomerase PrpF